MPKYWQFVWPFLEYAINPNKSLWREEDYPKLKPFFDFQCSQEWTPEIKESFDFYVKCQKEYGENNKEIRDAVSQFTPEEILEGFGYLDSDEDEYSEDKPLPLAEELSFPFIVVGQLSSEFDRLGKIKVMGLNMVCLSDFDLAVQA